MDLFYLSPVGLATPPLTQGLIAENYRRSKEGVVYVSGWWVNGKDLPDSETHINLQKGEALVSLPADKSCCIWGIENIEAFLASIEMVSCNEDGSDIEVPK